MARIEAVHVNCESLPKLAILGGTGDQGSALALRWAIAGYPVTLGSRSLERARNVADRLSRQHCRVELKAAKNRDAAAAADIVVLTVPFSVQSGLCVPECVS